jgi:general L-amino acid transport system permease protein
MASFMFPLFMPSGTNPDVLLRVAAGIILFSAAYQAEVIRGGINSVPKGQIEAAQALGMGYWLIQTRIVLPQAFRVVVPPLVNSFIAIFKDTSLVTIVSMYELFGSLRLALGDPEWRAFYIEGFIFVALIYWVFCSAMSSYARGLERDFAVARR